MTTAHNEASVQSCRWLKETTRMEGTRYYLGCQAARGVANWDTIPHSRCYRCSKPVQIVDSAKAVARDITAELICGQALLAREEQS